MQILLNKEKLDFTLENETTLLDVILSIENWLEQQNVVISAINVDGLELTPDMQEKLEEFQVSNINNVEIETATHTEFAFQSLNDAGRYIDRFLSEIDKGRENFILNKNEKIDGLNWLADIIFSSANVLQVNISSIFINHTNLEEVIAFLVLSSEQLEKKKHDDLFFYDYFVTGVRERLDLLKQMLPLIIQHAIFQLNNEDNYLRDDNIIKIIKSLKNDVYIMAPTLEKISQNFQSGKDLDALIGIKKVSGVLDNLVNSLTRIGQLLGLNYKVLQISGRTIEEINKSLLDVLTQIFNAFQDQDTVLLADLIEYELSDFFELYKGVLETLTIIANQKKMVN